MAVFELPEPGPGGADDNEMTMRTGPEMSADHIVRNEHVCFFLVARSQFWLI